MGGIAHSSINAIISCFKNCRVIKTNISQSGIFGLKIDDNVGPIVFYWEKFPLTSFYFIYMLSKVYENYLYIIFIQSKILKFIKL